MCLFSVLIFFFSPVAAVVCVKGKIKTFHVIIFSREIPSQAAISLGVKEIWIQFPSQEQSAALGDSFHYGHGLVEENVNSPTDE